MVGTVSIPYQMWIHSTELSYMFYLQNFIVEDTENPQHFRDIRKISIQF